MSKKQKIFRNILMLLHFFAADSPTQKRNVVCSQILRILLLAQWGMVLAQWCTYRIKTGLLPVGNCIKALMHCAFLRRLPGCSHQNLTE